MLLRSRLVHCVATRSNTMKCRNKCAACFRQYNKMEHLVEHMRVSFHSVHDTGGGNAHNVQRTVQDLIAAGAAGCFLEDQAWPKKCGYMRGKQVISTEEHAAKIASARDAIGDADFFRVARTDARATSAKLGLSDAISQANLYMEGLASRICRLNLQNLPNCSEFRTNNLRLHGLQVVALGCKMVGDGSDGSLDLCARVCPIDEGEDIIFQSYIRPQISVTNYRYEVTDIRAGHLRDSMPLKQAQRKIMDLLCNREAVQKIGSRAGKARILVGHGLDHDLECLGINYPGCMI